MKISHREDSRPSRGAPPTAAALAVLDVAEELAQTRGYNGFSYADIAARLGVTKASLHYHFPSKADLGRALIERYHAEFAAALEKIDREAEDPRARLERYVALYDAVVRNDRMCLCGMLAAEHATLPQKMQEQLQLFFDANERWLAAVIDAGCRAGRFAVREGARECARVFLGSLEGAMLVARSYDDPRRFRSSAEYLLAELCKSSARVTRKRPARGRAQRS
jgi:TetR/AcrR family transcriptional repressor of nem operon